MAHLQGWLLRGPAGRGGPQAAGARLSLVEELSQAAEFCAQRGARCLGMQWAFSVVEDPGLQRVSRGCFSPRSQLGMEKALCQAPCHLPGVTERFSLGDEDCF